MNNRPEKVGPPGLSNKDPGAGLQLRTVGRRRGRGRASGASNLAAERKRRIEAARARREEEERQQKELEKNNNVTNTNVNVMNLGLYTMTTQIQTGSQIERAFANLIGNKVVSDFSKETKLGNLNYKILEFVGRDKKFKKMFSITREYGLKYDWKEKELPKNSIFEFKIRVTGNGQSALGMVTVFNATGKVTIRGGYLNSTSKNDFAGLEGQPKALLMALFQMYGLKPAIPELKRGITVATTRLGRKFNEKEFLKNTIRNDKFGEFKINRSAKEKSVSRVQLRSNNNPHVISFSKGGVVQVRFSGKINKQTLKSYFTKVTSFTKMFSKYIGGKSQITAKKKKSLVRTNTTQAPNVARRGTTCPPAKRPTPYSFAGKCPAGMYVRPNPQQQPCCYKIGKKPSALKNKVRAAYNRVDVAVPKNVQDIFGISTNKNKNTNISTNLPSIQMFKTVTRVRKADGTMVNVPNVRIGSRQCLRYTKEKILDFVIRTGYNEAGLASKTKEQLCRILYDQLKNTNTNKTNDRYIPSFTFKGKKTQLTLKMGKFLMIGRRECASLPKADMIKVCRALGITLNDNPTRPEMCRRINEKRESMQNKLNKNKENKQTQNIYKQVNAEIRAEEKARKNKAQKNKKRDEVLYQMFLTKIEPFVQKYEEFNSRNTIPTQSKFLGNFRTSVNMNLTRPVENINARGWKKPFESWLRLYVEQYKSVYKQRFINERVRREEKERLNRLVRKQAAKKKVKYTLAMAEKDLERFKKTLPKNLQPFMDKKKSEFAKNLKEGVEKINTGTAATRVKAYFNYERAFNNGKIRKYLEGVVKKLPPKKLGNNKIQRYELNRNFKLVLGAKRNVI